MTDSPREEASNENTASRAVNHAARSAVGYTYRRAKKIVIFVIGVTVGLLGVVMLIAPGPGIVVIAAALAILATEFVWARVWLRKLKKGAMDGVRKTRGLFGRRKRKSDADDSVHA